MCNDSDSMKRSQPGTITTLVAIQASGPKETTMRVTAEPAGPTSKPLLPLGEAPLEAMTDGSLHSRTVETSFEEVTTARMLSTMTFISVHTPVETDLSPGQRAGDSGVAEGVETTPGMLKGQGGGETKDERVKKVMLGIGVGVAIPVFLALLCGCLVWIQRKRRRRRRSIHRREEGEDEGGEVRNLLP